MLPKYEIGDMLISVEYGTVVKVIELDPYGETGYRIYVKDYANYPKEYPRSDARTYTLAEKDVYKFVQLTEQSRILYGPKNTET